MPSMTNPPHINFPKANMVLGYLSKEADLKAIIDNPAEPKVDVYKKSTNETFQFSQPIIDVLVAIGTDGKDAASITKDQILAYGRAVLLGEATAKEPETAVVEIEDEEVVAAPPPPPVAAPVRAAPPRPPVAAAPAPLRAPAAPAVIAPTRAVVVAKPSTPETHEELTDQHLKNSSGVLIFQLLCGAKQIAKDHDRAAGHEARLQKVEALWKEYAAFVKT